MSQTVYTTNYINDFDPTAYLTSYRKDIMGNPSEGNMLMKEIEFLHEAFSGNTIKGERLLDIGTGPSIHSVISASAHADCSYLSDFAPQNRDALEKWRNGQLDHSFSDFFRFVVDSESNGEDPLQREVQLRKKISEIVAIDLTQGDPLPPSVSTPFDIITSSIQLESTFFLTFPYNLKNYFKHGKRVAWKLLT